VSELPKGWAKLPLDEAAKLIRGVSYKKNEASSTPMENYLPILRANNIQNGKLIYQDYVYVPDDKIKVEQYIKANDIVIAMSSGSKNLVGKSGISKSDFDGAFGTFCGLLRPSNELDSRFVGWFTRSQYYAEKVSTLSKGVNINNLKPSHFSEIHIPVAPLNEQIRIADKLDSMLAKVDAAQARLDKIPNILKRFRQSVLAAATSGELTKEWRDNNMTSWSCDKCTVSDIAKNEKYSLGIGPFGSNLKVGDYRDEGHPLVFVRDIRGRNFGGQKTNFVNLQKFDELKAHRVKPGNILITKMGDPPGDVAIYPNDRPEAVITSDCIKLDVNEEMASKDYVFYYMQSESFQIQIKEITAGVAQQKVNLKNFRALNLLFPKKSEQIEIVRRVESLFTMADTVEKQYKDAKARTNRLTQSILAKAFRGELVPQDESDEPASVLLEKISSKLIDKPSKKTKKKVTSEPEKATSPVKQTISKKAVVMKSPHTTKVENTLTLSWSKADGVYVEKAIQNLKGATFTTEQFQSVTGFNKTYEELKTLILSLVKGVPGISEPLIEIIDWEEKTGEYSFKLKDLK
jgi:type I restriction enzyme S subunit